MLELSTHIEYLLLSQSQVNVPQLGTFTAAEMSSRRVEEEGIFLPPFRTVTFKYNEQEAGEDFISSFSKMHNLSRQDARIVCAEYVDEFKQTLEEEETVSFGSMGYMLRDVSTGDIQFMPMQSGIASPSFYGLDALSFAKLSLEQRQQRAKQMAARRVRLTSVQTDQDTITIRINRRAFNYATAVAASVVLFFAVTSPFGKSVTTEVSQKAELFFSPKASEVQKNKPAEVKPVVKVEPQPRQVSANNYAIVMASALSEKRALSYAKQLRQQGFDAQACMTGKMIRVVIPGFATEDEAYEKIRQCKSSCADFAQAWPMQIKGEITKL